MGGVLTVVSVRIIDFDVIDGSFVRTHLKANDKFSLFLSFFRYARDFNDCPDAQRFALRMQQHGHGVHMMDRGTNYLTALGALVSRWMHLGEREGV